ncbi:MAG: InlB B-repeat-containing protein [Treponema sp.]|nr:InlB B-repeat-containing protein [Treponema sp.]
MERFFTQMAKVGKTAAFFVAAALVFTLTACSNPSGGGEPEQFTITFNSQGGSAVAPVTADEGTRVSKPADPTKADYTFEGWHSAAEGGTLYTWPHTLNGNVTMYARWAAAGPPPAQQYTITFNSQGGSTVNSITADEGTRVPKPADPTRTNYTFEGWYSATSGGTLYAWPYALNGNITMYARWTAVGQPPVQRHTITFDSQGGSETPPVTAREGTAVAKPADPVLEGYDFQGWFDAETGGTAYAWPHTLNAAVTMYAQWTLATYSISYNLSGGTNAAENPAEYTINSAEITLAAPSRAGYTFGGWFTSSGAAGTAVTVIPAGSTGDRTLYARWAPVSYNISYNLAGGTNAAANPLTYTIRSAAINLAAPGRAGHAFDGWFENEGFTGPAVTTIAAGSIGDRAFYAKWTLITYTITFDSQGGSPVNPITAAGGTQVLKPADPTKADHTFDRWHSAASGGTPYAWPHTLTGNVTMHAHWQALLTGTASISGNYEGGTTALVLTAVTGALGGSGTIKYQWERADSATGTFVAIEGAAGATYNLVAPDQGKYIRVTVSRPGYSGTKTSAAAGPVSLPSVTGTTTITGEFDTTTNGNEDLVLTADATGTVQGEGIVYQWERSDNNTTAGPWTPIASGKTYRLIEPDDGKYIRATASRTGFSGSATSSSVLGPVVLAPTFGTPTIIGTAEVTRTLTADASPLTGTGTAFTYKWERSDTGNDPWTPISGGETYRLTAQDAGKYIRVTAGRVGYKGSGSSSSEGPVAFINLSGGTVTIGGTAEVHETLTVVDTSSLGGNNNTPIRYQWERSDTGGYDSWRDISGATRDAYTLKMEDYEKHIRVTVSRDEHIGSVNSPAAQVTLTTLSGSVTIDGEAEVRETLVVTSISLNGNTQIHYQWQRADTAYGSWRDIPNATGSAYDLTMADKDKYVRVKVSRDEYDGAVNSDPTAQVAETPGSRTITIGFNYGAIDISGTSGDNIIYKASADPNSITLSATDYTEVKWYVDGDTQTTGTGDSITLKASDYSARPHSITFTGWKDGKLYSQVIPFTVKN